MTRHIYGALQNKQDTDKVLYESEKYYICERDGEKYYFHKQLCEHDGDEFIAYGELNAEVVPQGILWIIDEMMSKIKCAYKKEPKNFLQYIKMKEE